MKVKAISTPPSTLFKRVESLCDFSSCVEAPRLSLVRIRHKAFHRARNTLSIFLKWLVAAFLMSFVWLVGCTSENTLSGSLDQFYRLQFDLVRARLYRTDRDKEHTYSELSIEYVSSSTSAVPIRVTLRIGEEKDEIEKIETGRSYDISKYGDITGRLPDGMEVPRFRSGKITFEEYSSEMDGKVRGFFDANFPSSRDTLTLSGAFETELELVIDSAL